MEERNVHSSRLRKGLGWIIALLGLWEAGDIAAVFVPGFGRIPAYLWNHIAVGVLLMIAGIWAARTRSASAARTMAWTAAALGAWLVAASFILSRPAANPGLWNDIAVGGVVVILGGWAARASG